MGQIVLKLKIFQTSSSGEYRIAVKYNDEHVPKSPRVVQIDPECEDAKLVTIHGLRDRGLDVCYVAEFLSYLLLR